MVVIGCLFQDISCTHVVAKVQHMSVGYVHTTQRFPGASMNFMMLCNLVTVTVLHDGLVPCQQRMKLSDAAV